MMIESSMKYPSIMKEGLMKWSFDSYSLDSYPSADVKRISKIYSLPELVLCLQIQEFKKDSSDIVNRVYLEPLLIKIKQIRYRIFGEKIKLLLERIELIATEFSNDFNSKVLRRKFNESSVWCPILKVCLFSVLRTPLISKTGKDDKF